MQKTAEPHKNRHWARKSALPWRDVCSRSLPNSHIDHATQLTRHREGNKASAAAAIVVISSVVIIIANTSRVRRRSEHFRWQRQDARLATAFTLCRCSRQQAAHTHTHSYTFARHRDGENEGLTTWYYLNLFTSKCGNKRLLRFVARTHSLPIQKRPHTHRAFNNMDTEETRSPLSPAFSEDEFIAIVGIRSRGKSGRERTRHECVAVMKPKLWTHKPFAHPQKDDRQCSHVPSTCTKNCFIKIVRRFIHYVSSVHPLRLSVAFWAREIWKRPRHRRYRCHLRECVCRSLRG